MEHGLTVALIIVGVLMIISIMMQPSKQQDALSALSGGGELFTETKARGFEAVMQRTSTILGGIWLLIGLAIMLVSAWG